ncbi:ABC transporter ATP-binding protein [Microbacterium sp. NPDC056052]|uniref:ABC transporter ATP-binding protein n=1 Tax=Microbacterium sp. NPDC056052 TaxID=3345695 RepID=UPI0035DB5E7F
MSGSALPTAGRRHVYAALRAIWRGRRAAFIAVIALFAVAAVAGLAPPRLMGLLIDRLTAGADAGELALYCGGMLGCALAQGILVLSASRLAYVAGEHVFAQLREEFLANALALPIGVLERGGTGDLVARTTQDISAVSDTVRRALPESLIAGITVILTLAAAVLTSPMIAPVYLLSVPILVPVMRWFIRRAGGVYERLGASWGPIFASINETATGARTVEALGIAEARDRSMQVALADIGIAWYARIRLRQVMLPWTNLAFAIPVFASLAWGGWLASQGQVSIGTVVSVTLFASALVAPLEALIGWTDELQKGFVSFARILGVGEAGAELTDSSAVPSTKDVELRDVRFAYREGHDVVHGVTLQVIPGERLTLVGPSGAGKSTLARLFAGIDAPTGGRVLIGGVDAGTIGLDRRRREIMLVSQESHIFATTILENVRLARGGADEGEVRDALRTMGALEWVDALDDGWDTPVGSGGHPLTGAQEQQLALARVLLADPHTIILDEATSAMDPTAARDLEAALAATMQGRTVIAIAHRLYTAYDADRIAVVDDGRIVELGSHDELVEAGGVYARLWALWRNDGARSDSR